MLTSPHPTRRNPRVYDPKAYQAIDGLLHLKNHICNKIGHAEGHETAVIAVGARTYACAAAEKAFGPGYRRLPHMFRIFVENIIRNALSAAEREASLEALRGWLADGTSTAEIAFQPERVLMHDTTCTPALVDVAGMRDALAEAG